jgi:hypothetical protein
LPGFVPDPIGGGRKKNLVLIEKIRQGKATVEDLMKGGATPLGQSPDGSHSEGGCSPCALGGQDCGDLFAVSLPGVLPSGGISWFQAQQACKNARKRLPTNAEWQAAVMGTRIRDRTIAPAAPLRGGHFRTASKAGPFMFDQTLAGS